MYSPYRGVAGSKISALLRSIACAIQALALALKNPIFGLSMILSGTSPRAASRRTCFVVRPCSLRFAGMRATCSTNG